ncbi:MAG: FeoB-associated Cys-rich membrane protein [Lentimicrobium sp.]|nr:FeoB-associated Cys-rich membrane protein [Lentimicrobium sp.]
MENYQEIIVLIIVVLAAAAAAYKVFGHFKNAEKGCDGCASSCSGCQLQDLKKEIEAKQQNRPQ